MTGSPEHTSLGVTSPSTFCVWTVEHLFSAGLFPSLLASAFLSLFPLFPFGQLRSMLHRVLCGPELWLLEGQV